MSLFRTALVALFAIPVFTLSGGLAALAAPPYEAAGQAAAKTAKDAQAAKAQAQPQDKPPEIRPGVPAPKALPPDIAGECAWTGKRVISLLARDDVEQAGRFLNFYRDFGCREAHLGPTFRCVIMGDSPANNETAPGEDSFTARVDRCWARD